MVRIVVIEDEVPLRESILLLLGFEGYDAEGAPDGPIGLDLVRRRIPDVIVCDVMMPGMDGFEIVEALNSAPETASIPVIFLSALSDRTAISRARALGVKSYLVKPVTFDTLLNELQKILNGTDG